MIVTCTVNVPIGGKEQRCCRFPIDVPTYPEAGDFIWLAKGGGGMGWEVECRDFNGDGVRIRLKMREGRPERQLELIESSDEVRRAKDIIGRGA